MTAEANSAAVVATGMVTGLGFTAPATCAALRAGISGMAETRFLFDGEWLVGCEVPFENRLRGEQKLIELAAMAISEATSDLDARTLARVPLLLCVGDPARRPRTKTVDSRLLAQVQQRTGKSFAPQSAVFGSGRAGGFRALQQANQLLARGAPACVVVGVDSLLTAATLELYYERGRLKTDQNSDGFLPGEAAAAATLVPWGTASKEAICVLGLGEGKEPSWVESGEPNRAVGLTQAIRNALGSARTGFNTLSYRLTDLNGEQYGFREAAIALTRTMKERKPRFDVWHPCTLLGEVGAATVPLLLGVALMAERKGYAPGPGVLCHFAGEDEIRGALVLSAMMRGAR